MSPIGADLERARTLLEQGELVAIPTETVYGLAANALDPGAVVRIFEAKNRPRFDPLIVHVPDAAAARRYARNWPHWAEQLAKTFWPGPLTLLLPKAEVIPDLVTSGLDRVGLRVPAHPLTLELLRQLPFPLAAPSANPFGYVSPTTAQHVRDQLGARVAYILDGGPCAVGVESTVLGEDDGALTVHRLGGVTLEQLKPVVGPCRVKSASTSRPESPGALDSHYAPRKRVFLGDPAGEPGGERMAALRFKKPAPGLPAGRQRILSPTGDLAEAARNLFGALRELDALDVDAIAAQLVPEQGLGRAINDRLRRAAADPHTGSV